MFPTILEVIISLILVYFLLSTLVSFINEVIAMTFNSRGKLLKRALLELFNENKDDSMSFIEKIYTTRHLKNLSINFGKFKFKGKLPEYIDAKDFSTALLEKIKELDENINIAKLEDYKQIIIDNIDNSFLQKKLLIFLDEIYEEIDEGKTKIFNLKEKIEEWFNSYMGSVSYLYKSQTKIIMFIISVIISFSMNIDSLVLIEYFYENKDQREIMINYAENNINNTKVNIDSLSIQELKMKKDSILSEINSFELPIGWHCEKGNKTKFFFNSEDSNTDNFYKLIYKLFGLFLTTIALTLGAPFWYQMMMNMLTVKKSISKKK